MKTIFKIYELRELFIDGVKCIVFIELISNRSFDNEFDNYEDAYNKLSDLADYSQYEGSVFEIKNLEVIL